MAFRKPRSDSKLKNLAPAKAKKIINWLLGGMSYDKVVLLLEKAPFYIETSERALCEFYQEYCLPVLVQRQQRAASLAQGVRQQAQESPADFDQATIDLLSRWSFEMASGQTLNPKDVKAIMTLLLKRRDQDAKEKSLQFEKEKFRASLMKKVELGLEELYAQIKDSPAALSAFQKMKEAIAK